LFGRVPALLLTLGQESLEIVVGLRKVRVATLLGPMLSFLKTVSAKKSVKKLPFLTPIMQKLDHFIGI
jgi:hypothetical protein